MPNVRRPPDGPALAAALGLAQLVPEAHAAYRPLLTDGLLFFLERLSPPRRAGILAEQLALPRAARPARRLVALLRQCPTLHKLGQVVARDRRLAPELRQNLQGLESLEPTTPMAAIAALIQREWGPVAGLEVASAALAEASVAVVVPMVWRDAAASAPRRGVFKVLRPGVEEQMHEELEIWSALGAFLEQRCADRGLPVLDYRHTLDSVSRLLAHEIRLDREQAHLTRAAAFYADSPAVLIPRLWPFCTARMTAMDRVDGRKVTDPGSSPGERRRLARILIEALIARPFWSDSAAVFHADPHAGNLFATRDGRLAILDWALVAALSKAQRVAVVQAVTRALTLDAAGATRAIASLGCPSDEATLRAAVAAGLRQVRQGTFPGLDWLMALLDRLGTAGAMRFPEELTLFRKAVLTLSGVIADVSGQPSIDAVLIATGLTQYCREWPARGWASFDSRAFGSHLSNADGFGLWAGLPATVARYGIGLWQDALDAGKPPGGGRAVR
jgi:ubiquinone biosynthesis protein